MRPRLGTLVVAALLVGTASPAARAQDRERRVPLTVFVAGDPEPRQAVLRALQRIDRDVHADVRVAELPAQPPSPRLPDDLDARIAVARQAYVATEFEACLSSLGPDASAYDLLAAGDRTAAARVLFWRVACHVGAFDLPNAERDALAFSTLGLGAAALPESANPQVEDLLARAAERVAAAPRHPLRVESSTPGARVAVDGAADRCVTPCTVDLAAGDHVVAVSGDGLVNEARPVRVPGPRGVARFEPAAAPPALAAAQWTERYAASPAIDGAASMRLLSRAVPAANVALVTADRERPGARLRAVLAVRGEVTARAGHDPVESAEVREELATLLRELLVRGRLLEPAPPVWKRPIFWVGVTVAAAAAAGLTAFVLYDRPVRVEVGF